MAYRLAAKAENDLAAIWNYVAAESGNTDTADYLIDSFSQRFDFLSSHPYGGVRETKFRVE
jgi:plasmid stabilization system protein ParE